MHTFSRREEEGCLSNIKPAYKEGSHFIEVGLVGFQSQFSLSNLCEMEPTAEQYQYLQTSMR